MKENRALSIDQQVSSSRAKLVEKNRLKLRFIVETIIFCGRQGLAYRGQHDDGPVMLDKSSFNHGNFQA